VAAREIGPIAAYTLDRCSRSLNGYDCRQTRKWMHSIIECGSSIGKQGHQRWRLPISVLAGMTSAMRPCSRRTYAAARRSSSPAHAWERSVHKPPRNGSQDSAWAAANCAHWPLPWTSEIATPFRM